MEILTYRLIEGVLEELSKTKSISASIIGPLKDSATVGASTLVGGLVGGPVGAAVGAAAGAGILVVSQALGYSNYKPLMTALREDFTEQERNSLYERLWEKLKSFVSGPVSQAIAYSAVTELSQAVQQNPELMESVVNELKETFSMKNLKFAMK